MPGGSATLTCVALGSPMPNVRWRKGSEELLSEDEYRNAPIGRSYQRLTNIVESVNYTCIAFSSLGSVDATAQVKVKGKLATEFVQSVISAVINIVVIWRYSGVSRRRFEHKSICESHTNSSFTKTLCSSICISRYLCGFFCLAVSYNASKNLDQCCFVKRTTITDV